MPIGMTEWESIEKAGMCGNAGPSFWSQRGELCPSLCMKIRGHPGPCEHLSGAFLSSLDREHWKQQAHPDG